MARTTLAGLAGLAGLLVSSGFGCMVSYEDDAPAGLTDVPVIAAEDELVYERELRWWAGPTVQLARLYRRADDSYLLVRRRWQGPQVYAWAEGELAPAGATRLADALASADLDQRAPAPGSYACTYVEALPATIIVDDARVEYLSLCPPEGLVDLATLYAELVELLLDCPLDPSWYPGEVPLTQLDCATVDDF